MSKPHIVQSGTINSATTILTSIVQITVADYLTGTSVPPLWKNKLSGYNLMRGTAVFKFVLNAQPFQAGRLILTFIPLKSNMDAYSTSYDKIHKYNLTTLTQLPNVELDIQDGVATLEAPYVAPALWYSRVNGFDWGTFNVFAMSTISSASSTTIDYTAYLYFKDFELAAPIYGPEMDSRTLATQKGERIRSKKMGVVSTFFDAVASPLDMLSGVPLIGSYTGAAANVSRALSSMAGQFGWSRPLDNKGTQIVMQHAQYQGLNYNGTNSSDVLAMDSLNQLAPMDSFAGSGVDEMSFNYLKTVPAYVARFTWSSSALTDALLFQIDTSMQSFVSKTTFTSNSGTLTSGTAPPFVYLSRYFKYYRGSLVITLKFVKTQFHSGRIQVAFTPGSASGSLVADEYVYRDIIDIKESSVYSFTLPYMHPAPFLNTGWVDSGSGDPTSFGYFSVRILNPLVAASTVAPTVECLVYASAGSDFTLSALSTLKNIAFQPEMDADTPRVSGNIGGAPSAPSSILPHALCLGECFTSVKQLLQLSRPISKAGDFQASPVPAFSGKTIYPYALGLPFYDNSSISFAPAINIGPLCLDYVSEIGLGYVFGRGGLRLSVPDNAATSGSTFAWLQDQASGSGIIGPPTRFPWLDATATGIVAMPDLLPAMAMRNNTSNMLDIIAPHYGQTPIRLNYIADTNTAIVPVTYDAPDFSVSFVMPSTSADATYRQVFRAGADDFCVGYFIGFPPFLWSINT